MNGVSSGSTGPSWETGAAPSCSLFSSPGVTIGSSAYSSLGAASSGRCAVSVGSPGGEDGPPAALCGGSVDTGLWGIGDCGDEERGDGVAEGCPLGLDG